MDNLVSIITPVYNAEKYIQDCIKSVINQTFDNWEHILIDDCSDDNSIHIIKKFCDLDSRIKLFVQDSNSGAGLARNRGIKEAKGRYISFLDADDYWHKDKLNKQLSFMIDNNHVLTYTSYYVFEKYSIPIYYREVPIKTSYKKILQNCYIFCSTAMYDTNVLGKAYFPDIRKRQDWVLWIRILEKIKNSYGINEPLVYYRIGNKNSLSKNKFGLLKHNYNVFKRELNKSHLKSILMMLSFLGHYFWYKTFSKQKKQFKGHI
ncbi:glycosyltransferase family 2 protein [Aquimarina sp. LLG6339-5]|uniref:glycosyltransferase family 2 protein n=1 Tax=Aquimarina sp. LLG6339-5 TaxID=3160830 RepID=UPI00386A537E